MNKPSSRASLFVDVTARADPNTTPLAQQRVTATTSATTRLVGTLISTADVVPIPGDPAPDDEVHQRVSVSVSAEVKADGRIAILDATGDFTFVRINRPFTRPAEQPCNSPTQPTQPSPAAVTPPFRPTPRALSPRPGT